MFYFVALIPVCVYSYKTFVWFQGLVKICFKVANGVIVSVWRVTTADSDNVLLSEKLVRHVSVK
jgi:hypothetical protein